MIFYGLDWVATVPPTIALCRKIAGAERVGVVFAWVFCSHQLGAAFAAWGAGFSAVARHVRAGVPDLGRYGRRGGEVEPDHRPADLRPLFA